MTPYTLSGKTIGLLAIAFVLGLTACGGGSKAATHTYSVTYSGNKSTSGTIPIDPANFKQGQIVTVAGNTGDLRKTGFAFAGWNTAADESGTTYTEGMDFTMGSADVTLYAKWSTNPTFTVTYDGNGSTGGIVPSDSTSYQTGQQISVAGNTGKLLKSGFSFVGWNVLANGTGNTYTEPMSFPMGISNIILYAKWTANPTYTVTYNGNGDTGGAVPTDSAHYEKGQTVTVFGNTGNLVRNGYAFMGWNTLANGTGATFIAATTFAVGSSNVTLYAIWAPAYTVTYNGNGNTGGAEPTDPRAYRQWEPVTVRANTGDLVRTNYNFAGWNTASDGSGNGYAASGDAKFPMGTSNVILYAQWTDGVVPLLRDTGPGSGDF